jgi:hypothetical protein
MTINKKSQIRQLFFLVIAFLVFAGMVWGITWQDRLIGEVVINESPTYTFDFNVSETETLVNYSDDSTGKGFPYFSIDKNTGVATVTLPVRYLGSNMSSKTPWIIVNSQNKSFPGDIISTSFYFNITNTNDAPLLNESFPAGATVDINETQSQFFNVSYYDIDYTGDDLNATWTFDGVPVHYADSDIFSNYTLPTNYSMAGAHTLVVTIEDEFGATITDTWTVNIDNVNLNPYFNYTNTTPGNNSLYINISENSSVLFEVNYSDPDQAWASAFELYAVTSRWYIDGALNNITSNSNNSNFTFWTNYTTVLPPNIPNQIYNVTVVITDTDMTNTTTWFVNVTNVNQPPNITNISFGGVSRVHQEIVNTNEGLTTLIGFEYSDIDANNDTLLIYVNGSVNSISNETNMFWNYSSDGQYNITFFVNDSLGENFTRWITVNVANNTAPSVDVFNITNSTLGTTHKEGNNVIVFANATDSFSNFQNITILRNGTQVCYNASNACNLTWALNYTSRGWYNFTVIVNDQEGLTNTSNMSIEVVSNEIAPSITMYFGNSTDAPQLVADYSSMTIRENTLINLSGIASDINGNNTIDLIRLYFNSTLKNSSDNLQYVYYSNLTNFVTAGVYNVTFFVNDTTGLNYTTWFNLTILNNTEPSIDSFNITNSTGGISYVEGDNLTLSVNATDSFDNFQNITIFRNGTQICYNTSNACNITWELNHTSRGWYNISVIVYDAEGLSDTSNISMEIDAMELAPAFSYMNFSNSTSAPQSITHGSTVTIQENTLINLSGFAYDYNGNGTIQVTRILFNGTIMSVSAARLIWYVNTTTFDYDGWYNVTFFANDTSGTSNQTEFYLHVINNTAPVVNNITVFNSTGGTGYQENMTLNLSANVTDANSNIDVITFYRNGTLIGTGPDNTTFFDFGDEGWYNITAVANDTEGLMHNYSVAIYVDTVYRPPVIENFTINNVELRERELFSQQEGIPLIFNISTSDPDGDMANITLYRNYIYLNTSLNFTWDVANQNGTWDTTNQNGIWNITIIAFDAQGLNDTLIVNVTVYQNVPPNVTSVNITNSTGGTTYYEGDILNVTMGAYDSNGNNETTYIAINSNIVTYNMTYNRTFNYSDRGWYNVSAFVNDTLGEFDINSTIIYVNPVNRTPQIGASITVNNGSVLPPVSLGSTVNIREGMTLTIAFTATDENGPSTIAGYNITRNTTLIDSLSSGTWNVGYSDEGMWNVTLTVIDDSNLTDTSFFYVNVTNNTAPTVAWWNITNSTNGTTYLENDYLVMNMTTGDVDNNIDTYYIYYDGVKNSTFNWSTALVFGSRGNYNVSFFVNDTEGLNHTVTQEITVSPSEASPVIVNATANNGTSIVLSEGTSVYLYEMHKANFTFDATDANGDIAYYGIYRNGTLVNASDYWEWQTDFSSTGNYNITLFVNDTTGLNTTLNVSLVVVNNTIPTIDTFTVYNSTNGTYYYENDSLIVWFNFTDTESNYDSSWIRINGTDITTSGNASGVNGSYYLNFSARGWYNVSVFVNDTEGLNYTTWNETIYVNATDIVPEITLMRIDYGGFLVVAEGAYVNVTENSTLYFEFNATDTNGNGTLRNPRIFRNGTVVSTSYNYTWAITFSDTGTYIVNVTVNDTSDMVGRSFVYVTVSNNTVPAIDTFTILNGTGGTTYNEGDNITVFANATDQQNNIVNITILRNGTQVCYNASIACNFFWQLNYTNRGSYNFSVIAEDDEGLIGASNKTIIINEDNILPVVDRIAMNVSIQGALTPNPGDVINVSEGDIINMSFVASDENGNSTILGYKITNLKNVTGVFVEQWNSLSRNTSWNVGYDAFGVYKLLFEAQDDRGAWGNATVIVNVSNNTAPMVSWWNITNSTNGTTYFENNTLIMNMTTSDVDDNIDTYYIYYDGVKNSTFNWSTPLAFGSRGNYNVSFFVNDTEGLNHTVTQEITVTSFEISPIIENATANNGTSTVLSNGTSIYMLESQKVNFTFDATDANSDIDYYGIYRNGTLVNASNYWEWNTTFSNEGNYNITLFVNDTSGLNTTMNVSLVVVNNTAPVIYSFNITNSTDGSYFHENMTINISFIVTDIEDNLNSTAIYFDGSLINDSNSSYYLSYGIPGYHNVTLVAIDIEGLNSTNRTQIWVNSSNVLPVLFNVSIVAQSTTYTPSDGDNITTVEGESITVSFNVTDINGNSTIDTTYISINGTIVNSSTYYTHYYPFGNSTYLTVLMFVNDSYGASDTHTVYVNVSNNTAPQIVSFVATNITGGTYFLATDQVNLNVTVLDVNNNTVSYNMTYNGTVLSNESYYAYVLPPFIEENRTFNVTVTDKENLSDASNVTIVVSPSEFNPLIVNARAGSNNLTGGEEFLDTYFEKDGVALYFEVLDLNGNSTINLTQIQMNSSLYNYTVYNVSNMTWTIPTGAGGTRFNITYYAIDNTGYEVNLSFMIRANRLRETVTVVTSSGGGGSSSSGSGAAAPAPPKLADVEISDTPPILIQDGEVITQEITIANPGLASLTDLNITSSVNIEGVDVEILGYNESLGVNKSIKVRVKITNRNASGPFQVSISANGKSGRSNVMTDSAVIYVNSKNTIAQEMKSFNDTKNSVMRMLKDNSECLGLMDMAMKAETLASQGKFKEAKNLLDEAREECAKETQKSYQSLDARVITTDVNMSKYIIYSIIGLLILILLPSIYVVFKRIKKKTVKIDVKEEEIEHFLEEFYE